MNGSTKAFLGGVSLIILNIIGIIYGHDNAYGVLVGLGLIIWGACLVSDERNEDRQTDIEVRKHLLNMKKENK